MQQGDVLKAIFNNKSVTCGDYRVIVPIQIEGVEERELSKPKRHGPCQPVMIGGDRV